MQLSYVIFFYKISALRYLMHPLENILLMNEIKIRVFINWRVFFKIPFLLFLVSVLWTSTLNNLLIILFVTKNTKYHIYSHLLHLYSSFSVLWLSICFFNTVLYLYLSFITFGANIRFIYIMILHI